MVEIGVTRMRGLVVVASWVVLASCSGGRLPIGDDLGGPCVSSFQCSSGAICVGGQCVESPSRCSLRNPDGDCPLGRACSGGICQEANDPTLECAGCTDEQYCFFGECVDQSDAERVCSDVVPTGACADREVCVTGTCTPIRSVNACSEALPEGLCPAGSFCDNGFCIPIGDEPCSVEEPAGGCPAGQSCEAGACTLSECSVDNPVGACPDPGFACIVSSCEPADNLRDCEELDCAGLSRQACAVDERGVSSCGDCIAEFEENSRGVCVAAQCFTLACDTELNRNCETIGNTTGCTDCIDGFVEIDGICEIATCDNLNCEADQRGCVDGDGVNIPARCSACQTGFTPADGGGCRPQTCDDIGSRCTENNRACVENAQTGAACGDCVADAVDDGQGNCIARCGTDLDTGAGEICAPCPPGVDCSCSNTNECSRGLGGFCSRPEQGEGICAVGCDPDNTFPAPPGGGERSCGEGEFMCTENNRCLREEAGGDSCGAGFVEGEFVEPIVAILIDQSGSMNGNFSIDLTPNDGLDNPTDIARWYAVEAILFGGTNGVGRTINVERGPVDDDEGRGLITRFQDQIEFTTVLYTARVLRGTGSTGARPIAGVGSEFVITPEITGATIADGLEPALNNRDKLAEFFAGQRWLAGTPTGEAVTAVSNYLRALREARVASGGPANDLFLILATDGEPDYLECINPNPSTVAEYLVLEAIDEARKPQVINGEEFPGVTTLSLGVGLDVTNDHFQDAANLGAGLPSMVTLQTGADQFGTGGIRDVGSLPPNNNIQARRAGRPNTSNPYFNVYSGPSNLYTDGLCVTGYANDSVIPTTANGLICTETGGSSATDPGDPSSRFEGCVANNWSESYADFFSTNDACTGDADCSVGTCQAGICRVNTCTPEGTQVNGVDVMAPCFIGSDGAALSSQIEQIFNDALACIVDLDTSGLIRGGAGVQGSVFLDDEILPSSQWQLRGRNQVEILGAACTTLQDRDPHVVSVEITSCATGSGG